MNEFKFITIREPSPDGTIFYKIQFNKKYTLEEFIKSVLSRNEWGTITVGDFSISYSGHTLSSYILECLYNRDIKECYACDSYGEMNYEIVIDDTLC